MGQKKRVDYRRESQWANRRYWSTIKSGTNRDIPSSTVVKWFSDMDILRSIREGLGLKK